jgi:tetratricopeptide (TPR) repeat protein
MLPASGSAKTWRPSTMARRRVVAVLLLALAANIHRSVAEIRSDHHVAEMISAARRRDWAEVIQEGQQASAADPCRVKVLFAVGDAYLRTGRPLLASAAFENIVAAYPNHMNALGNLGVSYLRAGAVESSLRCFERVLGIKPDDPLAHYYLSEIFTKLGRPEDADAERQLSRRLAARLVPPPRGGGKGAPIDGTGRRLDPAAAEP